MAQSRVSETSGPSSLGGDAAVAPSGGASGAALLNASGLPPRDGVAPRRRASLSSQWGGSSSTSSSPAHSAACSPSGAQVASPRAKSKSGSRAAAGNTFIAANGDKLPTPQAVARWKEVLANLLARYPSNHVELSTDTVGPNGLPRILCVDCGQRYAAGPGMTLNNFEKHLIRYGTHTANDPSRAVLDRKRRMDDEAKSAGARKRSPANSPKSNRRATGTASTLRSDSVAASRQPRARATSSSAALQAPTAAVPMRCEADYAQQFAVDQRRAELRLLRMQLEQLHEQQLAAVRTRDPHRFATYEAIAAECSAFDHAVSV